MEGKKEEEKKPAQTPPATPPSTPEQGKTSGGTGETETPRALAINSKYDFVPGEKVIFFDDFTAESVGDFPVQWNTRGSGEVVTTDAAPGRWFHITNSRGITTLDEAVTLPENYTIEFDVIPVPDAKNNNSTAITFSIVSTTKPKVLNYGLARPGEAGIRFSFRYSNSTEGKLVSYGIFFDVNKDVVKAESYPTLKQIAAVLAENPTVRVSIVGHTDADGDDKANLDLSKRRASAVKEALVRDFQIDAGRLETDGKGESAPVAPNDSMTNKALNRRVEFIKL